MLNSLNKFLVLFFLILTVTGCASTDSQQTLTLVRPYRTGDCGPACSEAIYLGTERVYKKTESIKPVPPPPPKIEKKECESDCP